MNDRALTEKEREAALCIARSAVEAAARGERITLDRLGVSWSSGGALKEHRGAFVTLHTREGHLRGCIGIFEPDQPLAEVLLEMGEAAAVRDPRFPPLTEKEVPNVLVEVSVLSPLKKNTWSNVRLGIDGVYIRSGFRSGCFLPQVARETGWDLETFLEQCAVNKAGLPPETWRESAELFTFTVEEIHEKKGQYIDN